MKKYLALTLLAAATLACSRIEEPAPQMEDLVNVTFGADAGRIATPEARTALDENGLDVVWTTGDKLSVWDGIANREFTVNNPGSSTTISGDVSPDATEFYALYPYNAGTNFTGGGTVTAATTVPSLQTATANSFANGANLSAAVSTDSGSFSFQNVLSVAKLSLESANLGGHPIKSITLTSKEYALSGDAVVSFGGECTVSAGASFSKSVTISSADGSALADGNYYLTLLPNAGGDISISFVSTDGYTATREATLSKPFTAGVIKNLGTIRNLVWQEPAYRLVTESQTDWTGEYVIAYTADDVSGLALADNNGSNYGATGNVSIIGGTTITKADGDSYKIVITKTAGGYSLKRGEYYIGNVSDNGNLNYSTSFSSGSFEWEITYSAPYVLFRNVSHPNRYIYYNPKYTNFGAIYRSDGSSNTKLYKLTSTETPLLQITTGAASGISEASATLNASYTGLGSNFQGAGFYLGTSSDEAVLKTGTPIYSSGTLSSGSGSFSAIAGSLSASTTYHYLPFIEVFNSETNSYEEAYGAVGSFTTTGGPSGPLPQWGWLELPAYASADNIHIGTFFNGNPNDQATGENGKDRNYTYYYDKVTFTAMWVAYPLYKESYGGGRDGKWQANPNIDLDYQINVWKGSYGVNYGSGNNYYARGHQIPDGDRSNIAGMQSQTYYVTNSTPQIQNKFNSGIWNSLEGAVRTATTAFNDTVYVVTGPAFRKVGGSETITYIQPKYDEKQCPVPNYYWKVLLKVKRSGDTVSSASAIGFWIDHREHPDAYPNYAVSVDAIEEYTGLDFFANLPGELQTSAESNSSWESFQNFK